MTNGHQRARARELGELFVSITGDDTVTEHQHGGQPSKELRGETERPSPPEDGLQAAIDADQDGDVA